MANAVYRVHQLGKGWSNVYHLASCQWVQNSLRLANPGDVYEMTEEAAVAAGLTLCGQCAARKTQKAAKHAAVKEQRAAVEVREAEREARRATDPKAQIRDLKEEILGAKQAIAIYELQGRTEYAEQTRGELANLEARLAELKGRK